MDNLRRWHQASSLGVYKEIPVKGIPRQGYVVKSSQNEGEEVLEYYYKEGEKLFIIPLKENAL